MNAMTQMARSEKDVDVRVFCVLCIFVVKKEV